MSNYFKMFKAYDIRGTYPEISEELYYLVGKGLIKTVFEPENLGKEVIIVRDCRYTSPQFYKALFNGIKDAGGEPIGLGVGSSDFMYAATQVKKVPGVMVTASHNPKDDNGMKIVKKESTMLGLETGLDKVRDYVLARIETEEIDKSSWQEVFQDDEIRQKVMDYFISKIQEIGKIEEINNLLNSENKRIKVAVDAGNGMGGFVMEIVKNLYTNIDFIPLYWELDGNYPNHPADPQNFENLKDLQRVVSQDDVDFGFAFDGDADRVFFVDERGEVVQGDYLVAFFASSLLEAYYEKPIPELEPAVVYIQPGSRCVPEIVAEANGIAIPAKQGHTSIKAKMQEYRAVYGGEFSGHHYFAEFGNMDSGILGAVLMIKILAKSGVSVSSIFERLTGAYKISNLMSLRIPEGQTFEDFKVKLRKGFSGAVFSEFDGISGFYPDWKFSMRPSNTEPVVRFILETRIEDKTDEKIAEVKKVLELR